ncbi:MAG: hypothetical protein KC419_11630 [Anaerolineales bacterium]|nr:hypothetical protein [Anaerolineales bacterium]
MTRHKDREYSQELFESLQMMAARSPRNEHFAGPTFTHLDAIAAEQERELRKMKKFRFQLLHRWLTERFAPCRVADISGGKGLLAYLLQKSGWEATVIDPVYQPLIDKYKDISTGKRIKIAAEETVSHINKPFVMEMGQQFDLLVGLHAHGCNAAIIDAASAYGCGFVLFPCCVIDEPFFPPVGVQWLESLSDYALRSNKTATPFRLNFKGQNIGIYDVGNCRLIEMG